LSNTNFPPQEITIKSDDNVLAYQGVIGKKDVLYQYQYTKSKTKEDQFLFLSKPELEKLIKINQ
tara:strand:+ start:312 stop:503 length:192 start_codon:yes stop_codon:yes gene_type:complete